MSQPRQNPTFGNLHRYFHLRLVFRVPGARRKHRGAVVPRHLLVRSLEERLVPTGNGDAALQLVRHHRRRHTLEVRESVDVALNEIDAALGAGCLGEGVIRGTEHGDEELNLDALTGLRVHDGRLLPRVVDKELLAGPVHLAHREPMLCQPVSKVLAELAVPVTVRVLLKVLEVQQLQGDARLLPLIVKVDRVRQGTALVALQLRTVEPLLKSLLTQRLHPSAWARTIVLPTAPGLIPRLRATCRWLFFRTHFCRKISRTLRMDSRSVAIRPPGWEAGGRTIQRRFAPSCCPLPTGKARSRV